MSFQIYVGVFVGDDGYVRIADRLKAPDSNVETYSLYGFFREILLFSESVGSDPTSNISFF